MTARSTSLLAALLFSLAGCAQMKMPNMESLTSNKYFDLKENIPWGQGDYTPGNPSRLVAVWVDTVMYTSGKAPVRGFGGRIMFYTPKGEKPIKVEGDLVVYAFDELGRDARKIAPDKKYVFPADQLEKHYSKGELGHSYSVWLPWDDAGGVQREISLIVRFIPKTGTVLVGDQTRHILPGAKLDESQVASAASPGPVATPALANVPAATPAGTAANVAQPPAINTPLSVQPVATPVAQAPTNAGAGATAMPLPQTPAGAAPSGVQQISHEWHTDAIPSPQNSRKMQTTTIDLNSTFGRPTPSTATQPRMVAGEYGTQQVVPSIAAGVETTVSYGVPPRSAAQVPAAASAAMNGTAASSAAPASAGASNANLTQTAVNPATLPPAGTRSGVGRPRNMGQPIERPVRQPSPWSRNVGGTIQAPQG